MGPAEPSRTATPDEIDLTAGAPPAPQPISEDLRQQIAERLAANRAGVAAEIYEAILAAIPAYRSLAHDPDKAREVQDSIRGLVDVFVGLVRDPATAAEEGRRLVHDTGMAVGRRRALQGYALDDVQHAAHLALMIGLRNLRSEVRQLGVTEATYDAAGQIAETLHRYVDVFTRSAARGFVETEQRLASDRAEERSELVGEILDGTLDEEAMRTATRTLGAEQLAPSTLLVVAPVAGDRPPSPAGPMSALLRTVNGSLRGPVRSTPTSHIAALVPHDHTVPWSELLDHAPEVATTTNVVIAVECVAHVGDLASTYAWLTELLAVPANRSEPRVVEAEELVAGWLAHTTPRGSDFLFLKWALGPVLRADDETRTRLIDVARALIDTSGVNKHAAERLGVDRRTVSAHRDEFEGLTGFSFGNADHRRLLDHALLLLDLRGATLPPPGAPEWGGSQTIRPGQ